MHDEADSVGGKQYDVRNGVAGRLDRFDRVDRVARDLAQEVAAVSKVSYGAAQSEVSYGTQVRLRLTNRIDALRAEANALEALLGALPSNLPHDAAAGLETLLRGGDR